MLKVGILAWSPGWNNFSKILFNLKSIVFLIFAGCDQNFTASVGEISSPNFPSNPPIQNIICRYRILAPNDKRIQLSFLAHPDITDSSGCGSSSLLVFENQNPNLALDVPSAQYCNSRLACYKTYLSNETSLLLVYTSLYSGNAFRFTLTYKVISGK